MSEKSEFSETVKLVISDLKTYKQDEISKLMRVYGILPTKLNAIDNLAKKLVYTNWKTIPFLSQSQSDSCKKYQIKLSLEEIEIKREIIYDKFNKFANTVTEMTPNDLMELFKEYDNVFYNSDIMQFIKESNYSLKFKNDGNGTFTTEGTCSGKICDYTITIPVKKFKNAKEITIVAGQECKDQLECLLRVMEHELSHLIIFMFCGDFNVSDQHGKLFMNMVNDHFGHTDHRHWIF